MISSSPSPTLTGFDLTNEVFVLEKEFFGRMKYVLNPRGGKIPYKNRLDHITVVPLNKGLLDPL